MHVSSSVVFSRPTIPCHRLCFQYRDQVSHPERSGLQSVHYRYALISRFLIPCLTARHVELALQRVEAQTSLLLSRQIGTPNIAAKGKPESRQVLVPGPLFPPGHPHHKSDVKTNLIQELDTPMAALPTPTPRVKGILKSTSDTHTPTWTWKEVHSKICIVINVPNMVSLLYPRFHICSS